MYQHVQWVCRLNLRLDFLSQLTFKLGLSYTPLAQAGLDALQYWSTALPADKLKPYMADILPCLDGYLKTSAESSKSNERVTLYTEIFPFGLMSHQFYL